VLAKQKNLHQWWCETRQALCFPQGFGGVEKEKGKEQEMEDG